MTARANSVHARDIASIAHPGMDLFPHRVGRTLDDTLSELRSN